MTLGAPCPTCRKPMTWVPAVQQWSCLPCGAMFAAQPVMLPAFPMAMQPRRGRGKVIAVSLAAVVGAGVAIALIAKHHKGGKPMLADEPPPIANDAPKPAMKPPPPPEPPKAPVDLTIGTPEAFDLADFWGAPRHDGAYVITSPLLEAAFPHKPAGKFDHGYVLTDDLTGRGLISLTLIAGATETRAFTMANLEQELAATGPVTQRKRVDRGVDVLRLDAQGASEAARVEVRVDLAHDLVLIGRAKVIPSDAPFAEAFFDSLHLRTPPADPFVDPKTLTVRVRHEKGKFRAHDATDSFALDLPWPTKVVRVLDPDGLRSVQVTVDSKRGGAVASLIVHEMSAWDALADTPPNQAAYIEATRAALAADLHATVKVAQEKLAGVPTARLDAKGKGHSLHQHMLWNRYQHRLYILQCTDAPCDSIALSLTFARPVPVQ